MSQPIRYLSVCSGIEAATVAWHPLGWEAAAYSEIDKFPRAVLQHHYPDVPLHDDFTTIKGDEYGPIDLLCGGTPCQDYSVAGTGDGLDGERGQLTLEFAGLAKRCRARWKVWENVPGVFSTNGGRDFGAVLATFAGYPDGHVFEPPKDGWKNSGVVPQSDCKSFGLAWRVLDLQFFGIPQRRRRVVLVGYIGDWRTAAAVLFEPESLQGHPAPRREKGAAASALTANGVGTCGADDNQGQAGHLIAHTLRAEGFDASEDGTGRGTPIVPVSFGGGNTAGSIDVAACLTAKGNRQDFDLETFVAAPIPILEAGARTGKSTIDVRAGMGVGDQGDPMFTLQAGKQHAVAFAQNQRDEVRTMDVVGSLAAEPGMKQTSYIAEPCAVSIRGREEGARIELGGDQSHAIRASQGGGDKPHMFDGYAVRRLTPTECERLMGFPDGYTQIPYRGKPADQCPDGPRYKALGNSWGVPVFEWVGRRIDMMEKILQERTA